MLLFCLKFCSDFSFYREKQPQSNAQQNLLFVYLFLAFFFFFLAVVDFHCCMWAFSNWTLVIVATGLTAPWHVGSSWTWDPTCVPWIGRWILNHWDTREVWTDPTWLASHCLISLPTFFLIVHPATLGVTSLFPGQCKSRTFWGPQLGLFPLSKSLLWRFVHLTLCLSPHLCLNSPH